MFFGLTVGEIVDYIILIGALIGAIYKIYDFFAKPTSKIKQHAINKERERIGVVLDEKLEEKLQEILYNHDLETRDKYKYRKKILCFLFPKMVFYKEKSNLPKSKSFFAYRVPALLKRLGAHRLV